MKHRGRHRRRRRGRALRAALTGAALALTGAATMISASQATMADDPGELKPLTSVAATDDLRLTEHHVPRPWLDRLSAAMATRWASAPSSTPPTTPCGTPPTARPRSGRRCPSRPRPPAPTAGRRTTPRAGAPARSPPPGTPTTTAAGVPTASSCPPGPATTARRGRSGRVSFVDADDPGRLPYTSALLAVPVDGGHDYRGLASPVSGMVWYQDKLLVTAGTGGRDALFVYDVDRSSAPPPTRTPSAGSPAAGRRPVTGTCCPPSPRTGSPTPPAPRAPARSRWTGGRPPPAWWRASGCPRTATAPPGCGATPQHRSGALRAPGRRPGRTRRRRRGVPDRCDRGGRRAVAPPAGAASAEWYLGRAAGGDGRGTLWRQDTEGSRATECGADRSQRCWSGPVGSLSYWTGTGEVWSQSGRMLFALPLRSIEDALD